jgi:hypothetical protein
MKSDTSADPIECAVAVVALMEESQTVVGTSGMDVAKRSGDREGTGVHGESLVSSAF